MGIRGTAMNDKQDYIKDDAINASSHKLHSCNEGDCGICNGGLALCEVCHGAEGSLTTDCCGRPITELEEYMIYNLGVLDFVNGQWVLNSL